MPSTPADTQLVIDVPASMAPFDIKFVEEFLLKESTKKSFGLDAVVAMGRLRDDGGKPGANFYMRFRSRKDKERFMRVLQTLTKCSKQLIWPVESTKQYSWDKSSIEKSTVTLQMSIMNDYIAPLLQNFLREEFNWRIDPEQLSPVNVRCSGCKIESGNHHSRILLLFRVSTMEEIKKRDIINFMLHLAKHATILEKEPSLPLFPAWAD